MPITNRLNQGHLLVGLVMMLQVAACGLSSNDVHDVGGYVLVYELDSPLPGNADSMVSALKQRLLQFGFRDAAVAALDGDKVEIVLAGADDAAVSKAQLILGTTGELEFRILAKRGPDDDVIAMLTAAEGEPSLAKEDEVARWVNYDAEVLRPPANAVTRDSADTGNDAEGEETGTQVLVLLDSVNLTGAHLKSIQSADRGSLPSIAGTLTVAGAKRMEQLTSQNLPDADGGARSMGILLDDRLISAPRIAARIGKEFRIDGNFSHEEVEFLIGVLQSGRLPAKLGAEPLSIKKVEPRE